MKVKCIDNTSKLLLPETQKTYRLSSNFFVKTGEIYTVYSILYSKGVTEYLVCLNDKIPTWCPAELFEIVDSLLTFDLRCSFRVLSDKIPLTIVGYKEIIENPDHHWLIIEADPAALEVFYKRKNEIDEDEELNKFRLKK